MITLTSQLHQVNHMKTTSAAAVTYTLQRPHATRTCCV